MTIGRAHTGRIRLWVRALAVLILLPTTVAAAPADDQGDRRTRRSAAVAEPLVSDDGPDAVGEEGPSTVVPGVEEAAAPSDAPTPISAGAPPLAITSAEDPLAPGMTAAAPAAPSTLAITAKVTLDGTHYANWQPGDVHTPSGSLTSSVPPDPGDDYNGTNLQVRTLDVTTIHVVYSVTPNGGDSGPTRIVGRVQGGPAFLAPGWSLIAGVGGECPDGFQILTPTSFACETGVFTGPESHAFDVLVLAPRSTPHGSLFSLAVTLSEDDNGAPNEVSAESERVMVSAGPRYELVKRLLSIGQVTEPGPPGSTGLGLVMRWAIGVKVLSDEPYGLSALPASIVLTDVVRASPPSANVWLFRCIPATNDFTGTYSPWPGQGVNAPAPAGQLAGPKTAGCTQSPTPGGAITATITGLDFGRLTPPPAPGLVGYFELGTWVSEDDIKAAGGKVDITNAVETDDAGECSAGVWSAGATNAGTWRPLDISDKPNLLGRAEPIENDPSEGSGALVSHANGVCVELKLPEERPGAQFFKARRKPFVDGDPVSASDFTSSGLWFYNTGNTTLPAGAVLCDKWDSSRFFLEAYSASAGGAFDPMVTVEYGTGAWGASSGTDAEKWYRQATTLCDSGPFVAQPSVPVPLSTLVNVAVPPPTAGYNMVRITVHDPIPVSASGVFVDLTWRMHPGVVPGEELRNYSAVFFPNASSWETSNCPGGTPVTMACAGGLVRGQSAGARSHWWTTTAGSVQIVKSRPDASAYGPGGTLTWGISARGVAPVPGDVGETRSVTVVDTLPAGFTYVPGTTSGVAEPVCTATDPQVCTWDLEDLPWSDTPTVTFTFDTTISVFQTSGVYTNVARAFTPDDPSPHGLPDSDDRVSTEDVEVRRAFGAAIDKLVGPTLPKAGDDIVYTLRYGNPSASHVEAMDAIDILPYPGDVRGSVFPPGAFVLTSVVGSSKLPNPESIWVTDADPATLDAIDGTDGHLAPSAPGVMAVPSPQWPCLLASVSTGGCGFGLADVTAVRIVGPGDTVQPFLPAGAGPFSVTLTFAFRCGAGDRFSNTWLAEFSGLLPLRSPARTATVSSCPPSAIAVVKEVQDEAGNWVGSTLLPAGADVTWRITVTNTGGTTLTDVVVSDLNVAGCETAAAAITPPALAPGESFQFACTDPGVSDGYVNTVVVGGKDPGGLPVEADDDATVEIRQGPPGGTGPSPTHGPPVFHMMGLALSGTDAVRLLRLAGAAVALGLVVLAASRRRPGESE